MRILPTVKSLTSRELATILAALREWQVSKVPKTALMSEYSDYFDGVGVLTDDEIDELCASFETDDASADLAIVKHLGR